MRRELVAMKITGISIVLALCLTAAPAWADSAVLVGVLEKQQCLSYEVCRNSKDSDCEEKLPRVVREIFGKAEDGWVNAWRLREGHEEDPLSWTVAYNGRNLGTVKSVGQAASAAGQKVARAYELFDVAPGQKLPEIANDGKHFGGQCVEPRFRPLVLVSQPNFDDPDRWEPFKPDGSERKLLAPSMRDIVERETSCVPDTVVVDAPYDFSPDELVLHDSYRDRSGRVIVSVEVVPKVKRCDFDGEYIWTDYWFFVDGRQARYLGNEMSFLDAGDYDGDGRSEVLFWRGNAAWWGAQDGYVMFYDDFRKSIEDLWKYEN